jgi:signal peptidase II
MADAARPSIGPGPFGAAIALFCVAFDQATKLLLLHASDLPDGGRIVLAPFAEFVLVWNRGISYGLFQQDTELGRWLLVALAVAAAAALGVWLMRTHSRLLAASIGLLIAGALGNAIDRAAYGAVVDFVHLHAFDVSWYVFNVADTAVVAGAALLLYESLVARRSKAGDS